MMFTPQKIFNDTELTNSPALTAKTLLCTSQFFTPKPRYPLRRQHALPSHLRSLHDLVVHPVAAIQRLLVEINGHGVQKHAPFSSLKRHLPRRLLRSRAQLGPLRGYHAPLNRRRQGRGRHNHVWVESRAHYGFDELNVAAVSIAGVLSPACSTA